jgi:hypothetical protein
MAPNNNSATPDKSPKPANQVINVPDPDSPPHYLLAMIGSTITWKLNPSDYPKFQLAFGMWNPFNGKKHATFNGVKGRPLALTAKNAGGFTYQITHLKRGSKRVTGTYGITVQSPNIGPKGGCPPACG